MDIPGAPNNGAMNGGMNLGDMLSRAMGGRKKTVKTTVRAAWPTLITEESDKLLDQDSVTRKRCNWRKTKASSSSTKSTRWRRARIAAGRMCHARAYSAICFH